MLIILMGCDYWIENLGKVLLILIEVIIGFYFGDDDIMVIEIGLLVKESV